jgi:hypothetical protein
MMTLADTDSEMLAGYLDGLRGEPEPGPNRTHSYRHGWLNGRDDRNKDPRSTASFIREDAAKARAADMNV